MREETLVKNLLQYKRTLEGMLFAMVGDAAVAEDLFQEMAVLMTRKREQAEETLVKNLLQYKRTLEGMLFAMVGDAAVAEDLFQEMAVLMTRKREQADENCKFVAWGRQIAVNLVRDWRKKLARGKVQTLDDDVLEAVAGAFEASAESAWDARREALRLCSDKLPEKDRLLVAAPSI